MYERVDPRLVRFCNIFVSIVCARGTWVLGGLLTSDSRGARLLRKVVPAALFLLSLLGLFLSKPLLTSAHLSLATVSLLGLFCSLLLAGLLVRIASIVEQALRHLAVQKYALDQQAIVAITERVLANEIRERLAALVDSSDDAIIGKDLDGIITAWNRGAKNIFGYSSEEMIGKPVLMLFPKGREQEEAEILARIGRGERVEHFETVRLRKDGECIDVSVTISPIRDGRGEIVGALEIARDTSERKRAERALSESDARLQKVLEVETVGVLFWDLTTGALKDANHTFLNLMGYSRREVEAGELTWQKLTPPEYLEVSRGELRKFAATGRVGPYEKEYFHKDGTRQWFVFAGSSLGGDSCVEFCVDISDRKKAEAALQESENRFRMLIEQASDAFFLHDSDGRFLEVNRQACESLGYTREELLRMSVFDVEHGIDISKVQQAWAQTELGKAYTIQGQQRRKDGTEFPVEVRLSVYYLGGKKLYLGLARDITERRLAEEALRRSDAGRVVALEAANLGEWEIELSTRKTRRSRRHDQIFGYASPPEWSPEIFFEHVHPEDRARARTNLEAAVSQGTKLETECRIILPGGEIRWIRACGDLYRDSAGNATRMFGTVEDITARKNIVEALRLSEERLRLALDGARLGTWHWNLETGELVWSPRCLALFGLPLDCKMTYEIFLGALHPGDRVPTDEAVRRSLDEHSGYDIELRAIWPDGSQHWIASKGQGYYDAAGKAMRMEGVVIDVTERKQAEEASRQARIEAEAANTAKSNFLANMSHEIRTPMNAIIGMTYLALRAQPAPEQRRYLSKISGAADSLLAIINDILDFSKMEAGKMELENVPFSLKEVLSNLHDIVVHAAKQKEIAVVLSTAAAVPPCLLGDPLRLGQVLINLVNNAIKFTEAGQVAVEVQAEEVRENAARLRFSVSDTGIGMSAEQVSKLFQSFSQADASYTRKFGGTGLGLAISKQLCDLMGGTLSVESEPGKGTTFILRAEFPLATETVHVPVGDEFSVPRKRSIVMVDDNQNGGQTKTTGPASLAGRSVLLVEDNELNRDLAGELLADLGISVTMAVNGREGADRALAEPFDLVLMDIQMPVMDGLAATRLIRADRRLSNLPIIAMTAHAMMGDYKQSLDAGMNEHLTKPINPNTLTKALLKWMPAERGAAPQVAKNAAVQDDSYLPTELAPFDMQAALRRTNGKPRLLRKMMRSFCHQFAHAGTDLRQLIDEGKREEAGRLAHTLKGIARTLEASALGDAAFAVENAIRFGDEANDDANLEPLIECMEKMLAPAIAAAGSLDANVAVSG